MATAAIVHAKVCTKCAERKPLADFHKHKSTRDGRRPECKTCERERQVKLYDERREQILAAGRERYRLNKASKALQNKAWSDANKDRHKTMQREWYLRNAEKLRVKYREASAARRAKVGSWRSKNIERARELERERHRRIRSDPVARMTGNVKRMVAFAMKGRAKSGRTFDILGYSPEQLRVHLERQFLPGMNWENYGEWHVDHILPLSGFSYETTNCPDFRAAWALTNLRPMWAVDNIAKGAKRLTLL